MRINGGSAVVTALAEHGVDTVFGIPGTHNLAIFSALADTDIATVLTRHEQGAGYAADGYARVSGSPGVCITTAGPAVLNALAAAAQAWSDSVPVLLISPGMPTDHPGRGNGYLHEIKDSHAALDAVVSYSHRVTSAEEIPLAVAYAFAAMSTGRPRPVHLEVPLDLLDTRAEVSIVTAPAAAPPAPMADTLQRAVRKLSAAEFPLIVAGGGAQAAGESVTRLAERLGAPVVTTANGKGVVDEDHPMSVGAGVHHPSVQQLFTHSDVVLAIGTELAPSDFWTAAVPASEKLIRIDVDATSMITNAKPAVCLLGEAVTVVVELLDKLGWSTRRDTERAAAARESLRSDAATEGEPWSEIMAALAPCVDEHTIVAGDSAMVCYYGALSNLPVHRAHGFLYPTGMGTLGYGLPAAIGAATADPHARILAILGDGGIMFTLSELATAAQRNIAMAVLVVDNEAYGEIRNEMLDRGETPNAVALGGVDFPTVAQAMGCHSVTITEPGELTDAVRSAFTADRPTLVHIREVHRTTGTTIPSG